MKRALLRARCGLNRRTRRRHWLRSAAASKESHRRKDTKNPSRAYISHLATPFDHVTVRRKIGAPARYRYKALSGSGPAG
jgi:hypothetical protein